jgi:hypothetical protein
VTLFDFCIYSFAEAQTLFKEAWLQDYYATAICDKVGQMAKNLNFMDDCIYRGEVVLNELSCAVA